MFGYIRDGELFDYKWLYVCDANKVHSFFACQRTPKQRGGVGEFSARKHGMIAYRNSFDPGRRVAPDARLENSDDRSWALPDGQIRSFAMNRR